ncbi:MAG: FliH/SctL family protein [Deferrisomatales bacterium]|nr:FliH/SctL family protein [Deferrisomatales bacterium]
MSKNAATGVRPYTWCPLEPAEERGSGGPGHAVETYRWPELGGEGVSPPGRAPAASGEELVEEARRQAERLLGEAREEARLLGEAARREGLDAGREEGRAALQEAADALFRAAEELAGYKERLLQDARGQVVSLALTLVGRLLGPLAERDEEAVIRVVERALQLLVERENLTLRVHPEDLRRLLEAKPRILESFDGIRKLTVLEDPSVKRGGCLVQTPTAEIDARLETQLAELARSLRSA